MRQLGRIAGVLVGAVGTFALTGVTGDLREVDSRAARVDGGAAVLRIHRVGPAFADEVLRARQAKDLGCDPCEEFAVEGPDGVLERYIRNPAAVAVLARARVQAAFIGTEPPEAESAGAAYVAVLKLDADGVSEVSKIPRDLTERVAHYLRGRPVNVTPVVVKGSCYLLGVFPTRSAAERVLEGIGVEPAIDGDCR